MKPRLPRALPPAALALTAALVLTACGSQTPDTELGARARGGTGACASTPTSADWTVGEAGVTVSGEAGQGPDCHGHRPTRRPPPSSPSATWSSGEGDPVAAGATVTAQYLGVGASTGKEFDSSWSRGEPATFPLADVIEGWQKGIPGMKMGGRRLLVIPAAQAYGAPRPTARASRRTRRSSSSSTSSPLPTPTVGPRVEGTAGVTVTGKAGEKPTIAVTPATAKVSELTYSDLIEGTGDEVAPGATVTAQYVGVGRRQRQGVRLLAGTAASRRSSRWPTSSRAGRAACPA